MAPFTKATVILNAPHLHNDMQVCGFTLDHVLAVINESTNPNSSGYIFKWFRRKWGNQKIRVSYTVCTSMEGKEYAVVNDVIADVPPDEPET